MSRTFKLIMLGDTFVGKTALLCRFLYNEYPPSEGATISAEVHKYSLVDESGNPVSVSIYDTAGAEAFDSLTSLYFRSTGAACIVISNDRPSSKKRALSFYRQLREETCDCAVVLIQNKSDLPCELSPEAVAELRSEMGIDDDHFFVTSATNGEGVKEAFLRVIRDAAKCPLPDPGTTSSPRFRVREEEEMPRSKCKC